MVIDEDKLWFDNSDHCMIRVDFKLKKRKNNKIVKREYIEYYSVGWENKVEFIENIEKAVTLQEGVDCMVVFHGVQLEIVPGTELLQSPFTIPPASSPISAELSPIPAVLQSCRDPWGDRRTRGHRYVDIGAEFPAISAIAELV